MMKKDDKNASRETRRVFYLLAVLIFVIFITEFTVMSLLHHKGFPLTAFTEALVDSFFLVILLFPLLYLLVFRSMMEEIARRRRAEEAAREAGEVKAKFTSIVSHELRTPLTAIKGGINIVLSGSTGKINEEQRDFLDIAKRNVDRLSRLINDVLDFQKLDAGRMKYDIKKNNINMLLREIEKTMRPLTEAKRLDFIINLDDNLPMINFDRDKITEVLLNLINNAIKFTDTGAITVSNRRAENAIIVSVSDTGIGIKEDDMGKIFESFSQFASDKERKKGSTGLGLAISQKIIQQHGGKIWAESELGKGSAFSFLLPVNERRL